MLDQCERVLVVNVLHILFHDGGSVPLNFLCINVDHTVLHQSVAFHVPNVSDLFLVLTQLAFLD